MNEFQADVGRKPNLTGQPKFFAKEVTNTRQHKQDGLSSDVTGIFGESSAQKVRR